MLTWYTTKVFMGEVPDNDVYDGLSNGSRKKKKEEESKSGNMLTTDETRWI